MPARTAVPRDCRLSAVIYTFAWNKDDPMRIVASKEHARHVLDRVHDRIADGWRMMDGQIAPGRYILGDELSVLDLYVTVTSRFPPWRLRFYKSAPNMAEIVRRVDAEPRLKEFWAKRFPFDEGGSGKRHSTFILASSSPAYGDGCDL